MICRRREAGVGAKQCPGSQFTRSRIGRWRPHHPCFNLHSVLLLTSTSNYPSAAHCVGSHLSPPSPSPRTFRRARGRRPGTARGLLQRPGKLLEIQTSSLLWMSKLAKLRRCVSQVHFAKIHFGNKSLKAVSHSFQKIYHVPGLRDAL